MNSWLTKYMSHVGEEKDATHFYTPTNSYIKIPETARKEFWELYCEKVFSNYNQGISECTQNYSALQLGFYLNLKFNMGDVKQDIKTINELILSIDSYVHYIISVIQKLLPHYFESTPSGTELVCAYLKRDENTLIWTKDFIKFDGKIIFPYARIPKDYISQIYHLIIHELQMNHGMPVNHLQIQPINGMDTLLRPIGENNLNELYGYDEGINRGDDNSEFISLFEIYGPLLDVKTTYSIYDVFNPALHAHVANNQLPFQTIKRINEENNLSFWLPLFFSVDFYNIPLNPKHSLNMAVQTVQPMTMAAIRKAGPSCDELYKTRQLIALLDEKRINDEWSWIDIGRSIYSVDKGEEGLKLWQWATSQASTEKDAEDCQSEWMMFGEDNSITIATLEYFAHLDNPVKYEEYRANIIKPLLGDAIEKQTHTSIAKAFHAMYPHAFLCADYTNSVWYTYQGHRWVRDDGNFSLQWQINERFVVRLEEYRAKISTEMINQVPETKRKMETDIQLITQLIAQMSKNGFKENVCR